MKQLVRDVNAAGEYYALYCGLEAMQDWSEPERGIPAVLERLRLAFEDSGMPGGFTSGSEGTGRRTVNG